MTIAARSPRKTLRILGMVILIMAIVESLLGSSLISGTPTVGAALPHIGLALVLLAMTAIALRISFRRPGWGSRALSTVVFASTLVEVIAGGIYLDSGFQNGLAAGVMENLAALVVIGSLLLAIWGT